MAQAQQSCPIGRDIPPDSAATAVSATAAAQKCPVSSDNQVNPRNFMPTLSQTPTFSSQKSPLPQTRTTSTIPKSNDDDTITQNPNWEYPSPQQFFNAVMRKGFTDTKEDDVPAMVQIHNAVNERAWQEILKWEHNTDAVEKCGGVKLVKFRGDASVRTPKARWLSLLGYAEPFDTHFWTVDRCGEKVEYVIDFYKGKQQQVQKDAGDLRGSKIEMPSFYLDVRPHGVQGFPARLKRVFGL